MDTNQTNASTVSVFIASYNHARDLPGCLDSIDSILAQTFQDFEIVANDDGSQDGILAVLANILRRHPGRVRFATHPGHANADFFVRRGNGKIER